MFTLPSVRGESQAPLCSSLSPHAVDLPFKRVHIKLVKIAYDSAKDDNNRKKHGIPLTAAMAFEWDTALERVDDRFDYGEIRFVAIGLISGQLHVLVFTEGEDDDTVRVISLRLAEKHEARYYHDQI